MDPQFFKTRSAASPRIVFFLLSLLFILLPLGKRAWAPSFWTTRQTLLEKPFEKVLCLAEFQNRVYVGVGRTGYAKLYRMCHEACKVWEDVTPGWRTDTGGFSMAMAVFNNALFVGTDTGQVFATLDGLKWYNVAGDTLLGSSITDMAVFNGYLYAAKYGISIWRSQDGLSWSPVVGPSPALHPAGFGESKNHDLNSIEAFGSYLYAGVGRDNDNGIQIWRTANGTNWTLFQEDLKPDPPPPIMIEIPPGHVHAMAVFNNKLYIGQFEGQALYRTDGSVSSWDFIEHSALEGHGIFRLGVHGGNLYLGMRDYNTPTWQNRVLLYESANGETWSATPGTPVVSADVIGIGALVSAQGNLYAGTVSGKNYASDPTAKVWVYRIGWSEVLPCGVKSMEALLGELKPRFMDMADLVAFCNPPPPWWAPTPDSWCLLFGIGAYGQAVAPTSDTWMYSPLEEIKTALQTRVTPQTQPAVARGLKYVDEINAEVRLALFLAIWAGLNIDAQGPEFVAPALADAEQRLRHAQKLAGRAAREGAFLPGMMVPLLLGEE